MKFRTISLKGIRNFDEKTIQFQDGLNIVCGPNESGKSTILDSLLFSVTGDRRDVTSLIQWKTEYSSIDVTYETDEGEAYTISRTLFPEEKSSLKNNTLVEDSEAIRSILEDHFGSTDKVILENSAFVKHNEMEIMREIGSKNAMKRQMQTILTGDAERSTEEVIEALERSVFHVRGSLMEVESQIEHVLQKLEPYRRIDEEYERIEKRKTVYEGDLEKYGKNIEMYTSRILYGELVEKIKEYEEKRDGVEDIEGYIENIPFEEVKKVKELEDDLKKVEENKERLSSLIKKREEELEKAERELEKGRGSLLGRLFGPLLGKQVGKEELRGRIGVLEELIKDDRAHLYEMDRMSRDIQARIRNLESQIGSYKGKSLEDLAQIKEKYRREIRAILQESTKEEVVTSISQKGKERDELRSAIFRVDPDLLKIDEQDIQDKREEVEKKVELLTEEIRNVKEELVVARSRKEEKDRIMSSLDVLKAQKVELELRRDTDQIALDTIRSVYADLKEQFIPQLEETAGTILQRITRGKYTKVSIRKEDLEVFIESPDRVLSTTSLSQGTRDQLHLSLRVALSELVSGGRNLPLLFDESLYTSDRKRLEETLVLLSEIAQHTQVILFTHNEDFLRHGYSVILKADSEEKEEFQQLY